MWILRTLDDGRPEQVFRIGPGGIKTLGRSTGADFIVDAPLVSRVHCRITAGENGGLEVTDLGSTNGTFVNGRRIGTACVASGDRIGIGRLELVALCEPEWRAERMDVQPSPFTVDADPAVPENTPTLPGQDH